MSQPVRPFQVLVGPNASGKTTFLDVPAFLGRLVAGGIDAALNERSKNFEDLTWRREGAGFELAIEARIPADLQTKIAGTFDTVRYEVAFGRGAEEEISLKAERVLLKQSAPAKPLVRCLFPDHVRPRDSIITPKGTLGTKAGTKQIVSKVEDGNDNFYAETKNGSSFNPSFKLGPRKSALAEPRPARGCQS